MQLSMRNYYCVARNLLRPSPPAIFSRRSRRHLQFAGLRAQFESYARFVSFPSIYRPVTACYIIIVKARSSSISLYHYKKGINDKRKDGQFIRSVAHVFTGSLQCRFEGIDRGKGTTSRSTKIEANSWLINYRGEITI